MEIALFQPDAPGTLTTAPAGFPAFVPNPPPRQIELTSELAIQLDRAAYQLGLLCGKSRQLPNSLLLIAPSIRREAVLSSRIEGIQTSVEDVYASELDQQQLVESADVREVRNYLAAYEYGLNALEKLPLSLRLIKELHLRLLQGVRGQNQRFGEFRKSQNWIGGRDGWQAIYVGPPVPQMHKCLDDFEHFLHENSLPPLIQIAIAHYQFEAIHPFGDGNGRVGRILIPLFLAERGLLPDPLLYLSAYFERTRQTYYDLLLRVTTTGDWQAWISYFLDGVAQQAQKATELADRLLELQAHYRQLLYGESGANNTLQLIDSLFINPLLTVKRAEQLLEVSTPTARNAVNILERTGILTEITGRNWGRVFEAKEILNLLS
jgi:Fic family protein